MRCPALVAALWFPLALSAQEPVDRVLAALDSNRMKAHLSILAHDSMEGRAPDTPGGRRAGGYLAGQFQAAGLRPAGDDGTWFHHFRFRIVRNIASTVVIGSDSLHYGTEQLLTTVAAGEEAHFRNEAVFAGYGISSAVWDDYRGQDVSGKVVVVLAGLPPGVPPAKLPDEADSRAYKTMVAARHGALATLVIHRRDIAGFDWHEIQQYWSQEQVTSDMPGAGAAPNDAAVSGWLSATGGERLLGAAGHTLDQAIAMSRAGMTGPIRLGVPVQGTVTNQVRTINGRNVAGRLAGSGPLADQVVVIGAHYDHLGIGPAVNGDSIYNGAEDNAGGTAQLLALAEAFARSGVSPSRSLLFVGFDAEEIGLVGAEAFVARPPVPLASVAAMINLDAANLHGATRDASALGLRESSLDGSFRRAARAEGLLVPASQPDSIEAFFLRSDQLPFARAGVPAVFVFLGWSFVGRSPAWALDQWNRYFAERYHQPADQMDSTFSMAGAMQQARVVARMALDVASAADRPAWAPGSRFRRD